VEELGDFISHEHGEHQQKQTHAEATEVFPHTPGRPEETKRITHKPSDNFTKKVLSFVLFNCLTP